MQQLIDGRLDVALTTPQPHCRGRRLLDARLVWAAATPYPFDDAAPVALVAPTEDYPTRLAAVAALRRAGHDWTLCLSAGCVSSYVSGVAGGLGVGVLSADMVTDRMRVLPTSPRLPALPPVPVDAVTRDGAFEHGMGDFVEKVRERLTATDAHGTHPAPHACPG